MFQKSRLISRTCTSVAATLFFLASFTNTSLSAYADSFEWRTEEENKQYWYENDIRQGTYDDPKGVLGDDDKVRGREIYDPVSGGWYWLDSVYNGAKAVSKEVWMPYIYQGEDIWSEEEIIANAINSGDMAEQIKDAIHNHGNRESGKWGKWVRYDSNGAMIKGWYIVTGNDENIYPDQKGNIYYYDHMTGLMAKGNVVIDNVQYHFNEVTGVLDSDNPPDVIKRLIDNTSDNTSDNTYDNSSYVSNNNSDSEQNHNGDGKGTATDKSSSDDRSSDNNSATDIGNKKSENNNSSNDSSSNNSSENKADDRNDSSTVDNNSSKNNGTSNNSTNGNNNSSSENARGNETNNSTSENAGGNETNNSTSENAGGNETNNSSTENAGGNETNNSSTENAGGNETNNSSSENAGGNETNNSTSGNAGGNETNNSSTENAGGNETNNSTSENAGGNEANNSTSENSGGNEANNSSSENTGGSETNNSSNEQATSILSQCAVGDVVSFGSYEQDNNLSNGKEPILWKVLSVSNGKALLLSEYALDYLQYHNVGQYTVTWETCSLRAWLNNDFYNSAFDSNAQSKIVLTENVNESNQKSMYGTGAGGNNTLDRVFCLSQSDIKNYLSYNDWKSGSMYGFCEDLIAPATEYAFSKGATNEVISESYYNSSLKNKHYSTECIGKSGCIWWLRSPGNIQYRACYVDQYGKAGETICNYDTSYYAVRPAMWVSMN